MDSPAFKELQELEKNERIDENWAFSDTFEKALYTGNLEIIKFFVEKWNSETENLKPMRFSKLHFIIYKHHEDAKTLEIINYLLPYLYNEDPKRPGFQLVDELYSILMDFFRGCRFLMKYFLETYYTKEHNALYPLLEKLERKFELSEIPCIVIFLHSDIKNFDAVDDDEDLDDILTVLMKLVNGDAESMQLAVEITKVFLDKKIYERDFETLLGSRMLDEAPLVVTDDEFKRLFQFVYHLLDNTIFIIFALKWCNFCVQHRKYFQTCIFLVELFSLFTAIAEFNGKKLLSLEKFCQRVIIKTTLRATKVNVKETMDRIWSLTLPVRVKCSMLNIRDASWMNELREN